MDDTKMRNYLVKTLFEVKDPNWTVMDRSREVDLFENYKNMHRLSVASFKKHLKGEWEMQFIGGRVDNIHQAFEKTFWFIHDLWHQQPCNILYTDPDTVAIKDINPWGNISGFRMFNFTDPRLFKTENRYNKKFPWFFNAGVRYFASDMSKEIWDKGTDMARNWDHSSYDTEQIILNTMLWDQGLRLDQCLRPEVAYQAHLLPRFPLWLQDIWNGISMNRAAIVHVHGSRNSSVKLKLMQDLCNAKDI
jgi:hypothetical protein